LLRCLSYVYCFRHYLQNKPWSYVQSQGNSLSLACANSHIKISNPTLPGAYRLYQTVVPRLYCYEASSSVALLK
jgi:hypothetical protein